MIRRIFAVILLFILLIISLPANVLAQTPIEITVNQATHFFPTNIEFRLHATSESPITDIRLFYQVSQRDYSEVTAEIALEIIPDTRQKASWVWDMRQTGGLPPGASLDFWWRIEDTSGNLLLTDPTTLEISDSRYDWKILEEGQVRLYWYTGGDDFARELMDISRDTLARVEGFTGAVLAETVELYIYASASDLQGSMIYPQEWTGGVTFTRYGIIAIGIAPSQLAWGRRAIAHELTHLIIHSMTDNPYGDLPTWLSEGLAMVAEGPLTPSFSSTLQNAINNDTITSVRALASPFSAFADQSTLAYAQSYAIVAFLIETYGPEKMFDLLTAFTEGDTYNGALSAVYGFDMDGLDILWREAAGAAPLPAFEAAPDIEEEPQVQDKSALVWTIILLGLAFISVIALVIWRVRRGGILSV